MRFTALRAYLSTATDLAIVACSICGAFGSAVLDAIISGKLSSIYASQVGAAAVNVHLPNSSIAQLLTASTSPTSGAF
jgi:hypothetical protein